MSAVEVPVTVAEQHPQVVAFLAAAEAAGEPPLYTLTPPAARAQVDQIVDVIGPGPELARVEDLVIDGAIPARAYLPARSGAEIVWFHGGGWVLAGIETHDAMCRMLASAAEATVTSVAYRLAPEHPFPAPLEDCWRALVWASARAGGRPLVVGGDSAGGNLAAVCALRARDRGGPPVAAQVLVYPVTDCAMNTGSYETHGGDGSFLTRKEMEWFFDHYAPEAARRVDPEISPLRATDLAGLPSTVGVTAGHDPLRDEGVAYLAALERAGVPVVHRHYPDMIHAFFSFVNVFDRGDEAVRRGAADNKQLLTAGDALS